ncbi:YegP family protein [Cupriavidus sp. 30B13]|uniref:YegP family protein n=1 Tax=Cupriavidus sp. 30B13 TaxID=3384241 RepID=UPI003B92044A
MYFVLYRDDHGFWRWTYRAPSHEVICASATSYTTKRVALHSIYLVRAGAPAARVYDEGPQPLL